MGIFRANSPEPARPNRCRLVRRAILLVAGVVSGCLLAEAASWCALCLAPARRHIGRWEFRSGRPAPYQKADYFNDEFLAESMRCARLDEVTGAGFVVPGDFTGRYCNVVSGRRRTTDQPAASSRRVLLFGGSTIFGQEVPDGWTVASCLQRLLNQRSGPGWLVENYGTCSMIAGQQTERLRRVEVRTGDIVVFYDGVNDVFYPIYNGHIEGWHPGHGHDGGVRRLSALHRFLYPLCVAHREHSATASLVLRCLEKQPPCNVADRATLESHLRAAEAGYQDALVQAHNAVVHRGARFFHFLQPNLFTRHQWSRYETRLVRNELRALPALDEAFALGYPALRNAARVAATSGVRSFDLSDVLDSRPARAEFYLDFCHVNHVANERIAEAIVARLGL